MFEVKKHTPNRFTFHAFLMYPETIGHYKEALFWCRDQFGEPGQTDPTVRWIVRIDTPEYATSFNDLSHFEQFDQPFLCHLITIDFWNERNAVLFRVAFP